MLFGFILLLPSASLIRILPGKRRVKVQQKVSSCIRSAAGAHAFCHIRGYLSTLRKQGMAVVTALELALLSHPMLPAFSCS